MGIWRGHDKDQVKSLDDRGAVGYLLDIDIWQSGTTKIMQDGVVVKGLCPRQLDPARYHVHPKSDLTDLEKGMRWRAVQDEFGKYRWIDHEGRMYQGTPYAAEPDSTEKNLFVVSMMHANAVKPVSAIPDVTCLRR